MKMNEIALAVVLSAGFSLTATAQPGEEDTPQTPDDRIFQKQVAETLQKSENFRRITAAVDARIVTLSVLRRG
jgi:hypothetical protein